MRNLLMLAIVALPGCVWPGTDMEIERDPATGAIRATLNRGWLAGPVEVDFDYTAPDGTAFKGRWASEVATLQQANVGKVLDLAGAAAKVAGGAP